MSGEGDAVAFYVPGTPGVLYQGIAQSAPATPPVSTPAPPPQRSTAHTARPATNSAPPAIQLAGLLLLCLATTLAGYERLRRRVTPPEGEALGDQATEANRD